jgi:hypothetical protein
MSRLSRLRALVAFAGFCSGVSLAAMVVVLATAQSEAAPDAGAAATLVHRAPMPTPEALDELRAQAVLGSSLASGELASRLLDRFDAAGSKDDLYEAVQWIARDWDRRGYVQTAIIDRMVMQHCEHPVLKWHWLCGGGD